MKNEDNGALAVARGFLEGALIGTLYVITFMIVCWGPLLLAGAVGIWLGVDRDIFIWLVGIAFGWGIISMIAARFGLLPIHLLWAGAFKRRTPVQEASSVASGLNTPERLAQFRAEAVRETLKSTEALAARVFQAIRPQDLPEMEHGKLNWKNIDGEGDFADLTASVHGWLSADARLVALAIAYGANLPPKYTRLLTTPEWQGYRTDIRQRLLALERECAALPEFVASLASEMKSPDDRVDMLLKQAEANYWEIVGAAARLMPDPSHSISAVKAVIDQNFQAKVPQWR